MNQEYMDLAFEYANKALLKGEVPVGAVIVKDNKVIACAYNEKESKNDVLAHAELLAIKEAEKKLNNWRLEDCEIYVTLEPCPMCASAIKQARISKVYAAVSNSDKENSKLVENIFSRADSTNPKVEYHSDLYVEKSRNLLDSFFKKQRQK